MSLQSLSILFVFVTLCGCTTTPKPVPYVPETPNKEKDNYINKVEAVVSEAGSALVAVVPSLPQGNVKGIVEAQVTRLGGIAPPSVAKVEEYTRIIAQNDTKAVERDKAEAQKVDKDTTLLWEIVEQKDWEIVAAEARAEAEFKQKVLWQFSTAGLGLFVIGVLVTAFTPFKKSGGIVMAGGMLAMASLWLFDSLWFSWIAGGSVGVLALSTLYLYIKGIKSRTPAESSSEKEESSHLHKR